MTNICFSKWNNKAFSYWIYAYFLGEISKNYFWIVSRYYCSCFESGSYFIAQTNLKLHSLGCPEIHSEPLTSPSKVLGEQASHHAHPHVIIYLGDNQVLF